MEVAFVCVHIKVRRCVDCGDVARVIVEGPVSLCP